MTTYAATKDELIWRRIGDEIVIITSDGLATHILNKTAARIWELCDGELGATEIVERLCKQFDVPDEQAKTDVNEVIGQLLNLGLIKGMAA
jgi:hypothetical protein